MKKLLTTLLFLSLFICSFAQERVELSSDLYEKYEDSHRYFIDGLAGVKANDKWGVINEKGEFVIAAKYDFIDVLSEGLFCFYENGLAGYMNKKGEVVIKPQFSEAKNFSEGLAAFLDGKSGKWGYIDKTGKVVIQPKYTLVRDFSEGTALVNIGGECAFDHCEWVGGLVGVINTEGEEIFPVEYHADGCYSSVDGWIILQKAGPKNDKLSKESNQNIYDRGLSGVVNASGEIVIPFEYDWINPPVNGVFEATKGKERGLINSKNQIIVPFQEGASFYSDFNLSNYNVPQNKGYHVIYFYETGKQGLYKDGNLILAPQFNYFRYISDDLFVVGKEIEGEKLDWGFGNWAIVKSDLSIVHDFGSFEIGWKPFEDNPYLTFKNGDKLYLSSLK